ncbi:MAG: transketolase family protein [Tannerellaceae bacterium]
MGEVKFNARAFARLGQSGSIFGIAATELHDIYPIHCISADMSTPAGLDRFKRIYPDDFINVGIAEQNMLGVAAGLASEGYRPICVTQAAFITMRSFEMVRQYMGYMKYPVITIGLSSGFALTYLGNTHYAIEDIAIMRSIPGLNIFSPADAGAAVKAFEKALELGAPTYIRLTQGLMPPIVYKDDYKYDPYKMTEVANHGKDVTVFATGSMVHQAIIAAHILLEQGIACRVLDVHCIKPLDKETVINSCDSKLFISIEEHNVMGGLGSAIADVLSEQTSHPALVKLGVQDTFSPVGDYQYLLEHHGLTAEQIAATIKCKL